MSQRHISRRSYRFDVADRGVEACPRWVGRLVLCVTDKKPLPAGPKSSERWEGMRVRRELYLATTRYVWGIVCEKETQCGRVLVGCVRWKGGKYFWEKGYAARERGRQRFAIRFPR
jgi:hypothetical protein